MFFFCSVRFYIEPQMWLNSENLYGKWVANQTPKAMIKKPQIRLPYNALRMYKWIRQIVTRLSLIRLVLSSHAQMLAFCKPPTKPNLINLGKVIEGKNI